MSPIDQSMTEAEEARNTAEYDQWLRAKVQAALDDPRPSIPHAEAMRQVRATIENAIRRKNQAKEGAENPSLVNEVLKNGDVLAQE